MNFLQRIGLVLLLLGLLGYFFNPLPEYREYIGLVGVIGLFLFVFSED
jgi:hypothetical protein